MPASIIFQDYLTYFGQGICYTAVIFSLVSLIIIFVNRRMDPKGSIYLSVIAGLSFFFSMAYVTEYLLSGNPGTEIFHIMYVAIMLEYLLPYILSIIFLGYLFYRIDYSGGETRGKRVYHLISGLIILLNAFGSVYGKFWFLDAQNIYYRGELFWVSQMLGGIQIIISLMPVFLNGRTLPRSEKLAMVTYFLAPMIAVICQAAGLGSYFLIFAITFSLMCLVIYIQMYQSRQLYENEKKLSDMKITLLLSQMRPHFLYNALSSISQLCKKDPQQASLMTDRFAEFLRKNMNDISREEPIPFEQELAHIQNYVAIEKMRFGDMIKVRYDIQDSDFTLPALVLQPIVENAIRYGARGREEGGMVVISARKVSQRYLLTVTDDGPGFRIKDVGKDGKRHLGIESVRERMKLIPRAGFVLNSSPGKGTTALFILPERTEEK